MPFQSTPLKPAWVWPALACAIFIAFAVLIVPLPGIQNDEAIFTVPLYRHHVEVMILSYLGALKTLVYLPIVRLFHPSVWALRLPVVLWCAATIVFTWVYTRRVAGTKAASIAAVLLATDPSFLLTGTLDWGPVALQHFLLMGGLVCVLRWLDRGSTVMLAAAFFAWGLGFWDKALFIWPFFGLAVAVVCVYPRQAIARIRLREAGIALVALFLGSFPLIAYNVSHKGATASQNSRFSLEDSELKVDALRKTLEGTILFDILTPETPAPHPLTAISAWERGSEWLAQTAGDHRQTGFEWGLGAALCLGIFAVNWAERRQMIFLLLAMSIEFFQILITEGEGHTAHHMVLLWPFPVVFFAIPFGALAGARFRAVRYASLAVVAVFFVQNVFTVNQYLDSFVVNGFPPIWTDAIYGLSDAIGARAGVRFEAVDWGYVNSLEFLSAGRAGIDERESCLAASVSPSDSDCGLPAVFSAPGIFFLQHTPENQVFPEVNEHLQRIAAASGYAESIDETIPDSHGRPMFQIVHFRKSGGLY